MARPIATCVQAEKSCDQRFFLFFFIIYKFSDHVYFRVKMKNCNCTKTDILFVSTFFQAKKIIFSTVSNELLMAFGIWQWQRQRQRQWRWKMMAMAAEMEGSFFLILVLKLILD
ncbi:hypothetical protein EUGRSUZ_I01523 [Eucalyptus grandis]|uniref:Uncharacterized protein n=2 Tax=Eucalyptus grandis TaxID=71139 RepID=A0ACC3JGM7_EUCGR|nr:hypothetical protein EUGRSUZ_I01523 [Eucalyptus grandis]